MSVPMTGIEPARPCGQWILNPLIYDDKGISIPIYTNDYAVVVCVIVVS